MARKRRRFKRTKNMFRKVLIVAGIATVAIVSYIYRTDIASAVSFVNVHIVQPVKNLW